MGFLSSLFGFDDAKPAQSQVVQSAKIPEELKPYVTEIMKSAQTQFQDNMARGYVPYTGKTTADLTPEELQSMDRITGLAGTVDPYISEAEDIYRTGDREFTGEEAQKLMSPYQQAVTDIELRKARERFEGDVMPGFEAKAISQGGGPGGLGTRAGIEAAELQRGQAQLLSDIQARGSQKAYADAKTLWGDQLTRERQLAGDLGRTGAAKFQAGLAEAGALEGVGTTKRGLAQNLLDESLFKFKEEEAYPQTQLAQYSGTTYGNPLLNQPNFSRSSTNTPYQPSTGQNLLGLGLTGLNIYGMGTLGGTKPFGISNMYAPQPVQRSASGGKVGGGLAGLPVVRKATGDVDFYDRIDIDELRRGYGMPPLEEEGMTKPPYSNIFSKLGKLYEGSEQKAFDAQQRGQEFNEALALQQQQFYTDEAKRATQQTDRRLQRAGRSPLEVALAFQKGIQEATTKPGNFIGRVTEGLRVAGENLIPVEQKERDLYNEILKEGEAADKDLRTVKHNSAIQKLKNNKELQDKIANLPDEIFTKFLNKLKGIKNIQQLDALINKYNKEADAAGKGKGLDLAKFKLSIAKYDLTKQELIMKAIEQKIHVNDPEAFARSMAEVGISADIIKSAF